MDKILCAEIREKDFIIHFRSNKTIVFKDKLCIKFKNMDHYFEITNIKTQELSKSNIILLVSAKELGYYNTFMRTPNFDLRSILDTDIHIVTDREDLAEIERRTH